MTEPAFEAPEEGPMQEPIVRLTNEKAAATDITDTSQRVESLIDSLEQVMSGDWPSAAELRGLPPGDFARLARHLSHVIDRLNTLRVELLGAGARSNARF